MATDVGTGATITLETSTWSAEIIDIRLTGAFTREAIDTSHMGTTTARTFIPSDLYDAGELQIDYHVDLSVATRLPPITTAQWWRVTMDNDYLQFDGFVTSTDLSWLFEEKNTGSVTIKLTGAIAHTVV